MQFTDAIVNRTLGALPISVATSLAIESCLGEHPDLPVERPPILDYPSFWINVRTLFRNLLGSIERNALAGITPPDIADALVTEMNLIASIIDTATSGKTQVTYYLSNYAHLETKYKQAILRLDNTQKQKEYTEIQNQTLKILLDKNSTGHHSPDILVFDLKLKPVQPTKILLLTHYAYDLLSKKYFSHLTLLESHTGKLKEFYQWHAKYYNGADLVMMPFREDLLQIFGDTELFRPMALLIRKELVEIATKYRWSSVVTTAKILYSIDQMKNPYTKAILKSLIVN